MSRVRQAPLPESQSSRFAGRTFQRSVYPTPDFAAYTAGKAGFGVIGAALIIRAGNEIIRENAVEDPAIRLGRELAQSLAVRHGLELLTAAPPVAQSDDVAALLQTYGDADLILDLRTINWMFIYFPTDWDDFPGPLLGSAAGHRSAAEGRDRRGVLCLQAGIRGYEQGADPRRSGRQPRRGPQAGARQGRGLLLRVLPAHAPAGRAVMSLVDVARGRYAPGASMTVMDGDEHRVTWCRGSVDLTSESRRPASTLVPGARLSGPRGSRRRRHDPVRGVRPPPAPASGSCQAVPEG